METVILKTSETEEEVFILSEEEAIEKNTEEKIPEETINFLDLKNGEDNAK